MVFLLRDCIGCQQNNSVIAQAQFPFGGRQCGFTIVENNLFEAVQIQYKFLISPNQILVTNAA